MENTSYQKKLQILANKYAHTAYALSKKLHNSNDLHFQYPLTLLRDLQEIAKNPTKTFFLFLLTHLKSPNTYFISV